MALKNWVILNSTYVNEQQEKIYNISFPWRKRIKTKDPLKTLNRIGDLFYFRPEYLLQRGLINKLEMLQLFGLRKKYDRIKACLLELK